jgi:hypothetical protein
MLGFCNQEAIARDTNDRSISSITSAPTALFR